MSRLALLTAALLSSTAALAERRVAILVGENAGDQADAPLRFAESDAEAMRDVLVEVGGVAREDAVLVRGSTAAELRAAVAEAQRLPLGKEDRLILYVSSHAGAGELHLRGSRLPIAELRGLVEASSAGVVLFILDTCEAGAAVRAKGMVPLSARIVEVAKPSLTGRIVIASAGPEEAAFESDELGGSVFTQHFIAGLRGAADVSRDGRVTLQEAYAYAWARTIDSGAALRVSSQRPVFDMDLQGGGELVLSEPARGLARLTLDIQAPGDWVIASVDGGTQASRFVKAAGRAQLAISPGRFRLRMRAGDSYAESIIQVAEGGEAVITDAELTRFRPAPAGRKGAGAGLRLMAEGVVSSGAASGLGALGGAGLGAIYRFDGTGAARGIASGRLSLVGGTPPDGAFIEREVALLGGYGLEWASGQVLLRALVEGGGTFVRQGGSAAHDVLSVEPRADLQLGACWAFARPWSLDFSVDAGALLVRSSAGRHLQQLTAGQAGVGFSW